MERAKEFIVATICPKCGAVSDSINFCALCGFALKKFCPKCGKDVQGFITVYDADHIDKIIHAETPVEVTYCTECGTKLIDIKEKPFL